VSVPSEALAGLPSRLNVCVKVNFVTSEPDVRSLTMVCLVRPRRSLRMSVQRVLVVEAQLPPAG
jgi:hypothetical protein